VTGRGRRVASYCSVSSQPETIVLGNISQKQAISRDVTVSRLFSDIQHFHSVFLNIHLARTSQERRGHTVLRFTLAYIPICYVCQ
jgi:hypothetical protein